MDATPESDLPRTSAPAARALANAGITSLAELAERPWDEIAALHGVGPRALRIWQAALDEHGLGAQP
ncbi:helix-hairpin-helix domain-containing protein [Arthrobacter sp.]|uniref:helix-hairpin-helix domain-containing protein n=1 Tax=Arthrobacter sp. TaxID=1667 RepID=UPI003A94A8B4